MKVIQYDEVYGDIEFPDGFEEKLVGKTFEEQMDCYRITESRSIARTSYGEIDKETLTERTYALGEYSAVKGLVVKGDLLVGVVIDGWGPDGESVCLPYGRVCTYYASDDNGSGTKDRIDYAYLICA